MTNAQLRAMRRGRERAVRRKRREAVKLVLAYVEWAKVDAEWFGQLQRGEITREHYYAKRPKSPGLPSDYDFEIAREEGAIS